MSGVAKFEVLGPLRAMVAGNDLSPGGSRQRRLLATLLLHVGEVASTDVLSEALWPDALPADHRAALHTQISRLRRTLPAGMVVRAGSGYRLDVAPENIDARRFEAMLSDAAAQRTGHPADALDLLDEALGLWRGTPYEELDDLADVLIEVQRLVELRARASEERFSCLLDLGRHRDAVADLEAFANRNPLREAAQAQLMTALDRDGRSGDALAAYERYRRALATELGIEPGPEIGRLHDAIVRGTVDDVQALANGRVLCSDRGRVPRSVSALFGRDAALDALSSLVDDHRVVTLLGPGGVGKTRLACELAARIEARFDDGAWFCGLAAAGPGEVALSVAATLGIEQRSGDDPVSRVADLLSHLDALVILDNCEHVADETAALVDAIVQRSASVAVVVTSRERLNVDGEQLSPVTPLPAPEHGGTHQPASDLFVDRVRAVRPGWDPSAEEREWVAHICHRLSGLPLAIELAAARLHTLTLDEVIAGLDSQLRLLTGGRRTVERHRSVAAAVAWSHDLLTLEQRDLFDAVSVFRAPFVSAGAAALEDTSLEAATELLDGLVECSVLHRVDDRYGMLEPLREFGRSELAGKGRRQEVLRRHARHMRSFAADLIAQGKAGTAPYAFETIERSLADLHLAHQTMVDDRDFDGLFDLVDAVRDFGLHRLRHEVLGWAEQVATLAVDAGCDPELVADAWGTAALGAWKRGDLARSEELAAEALAWSERAGMEATGVTADALSTLTLIHGRLDETHHWTRVAADWWRAAGDPWRLVEADNVALMAVAYGGGDATVQADRLIEGIGDDTSAVEVAWMWYVAGEVNVDRAPEVALPRLRRAVEAAERAGSLFVQGIAGSSLASLEARHGEPEAAIAVYRWLLPHWRRSGIHSLGWTTLRAVAELLARIGRDRAAATLLGAVTSPNTGHDVFGADAERLAQLESTLRSRLGPHDLGIAMDEGSSLSDGDATALALATFDELDPRNVER